MCSVEIFIILVEVYVNVLSRVGENDRIVVFGFFLIVVGVM